MTIPPDVDVAKLVGLTFSRVWQTTNADGNDVIRFELPDGTGFDLGHPQDCCETVQIEDITGDLEDLATTPILLAEESTGGRPEHVTTEYPPESETWTFYRFATVKGDVLIRFWGQSNGYYSESVYLRPVSP